MALCSAAPARSTGREAIDPRTACEPCWIRHARRTQAVFTYYGTLYCRPCLAIDGISADEAETIPPSNPVEKQEVHQPESEAPMATPAQAPINQQQRARELNAQGKSISHIAKALGVAWGTARKLVSEEPLKPRKPYTRRAAKSLSETDVADLIVATSIQHVDVRVSTAFLDRWFAQLPAAVKVEIFNRCQAE